MRMHFDTRAYTFAKPYKAPAEDDDHQINVELVAEAISNAKFWGYCTMIATLGKVPHVRHAMGRGVPLPPGGLLVCGPTAVSFGEAAKALDI